MLRNVSSTQPVLRSFQPVELEIVMKKLLGALLGAVILSTTISSVATPAFALGGCGKNFHRDAFGNCVLGAKASRAEWKLCLMR